MKKEKSHLLTSEHEPIEIRGAYKPRLMGRQPMEMRPPYFIWVNIDLNPDDTN